VSTAIDTLRYRQVIGHFATGVASVTCNGPEGPTGLTTNAITSVSLEPLLLLVCFDNTSRTLSAVREARRFAVNVLRAGQEDVAGQFASKIPVERKFEDIEHSLERGAPVLEGALAWLVCDLRELLPGGDHMIGIGEVVAMGHGEGEPLVWYRGSYVPPAS
jgi:flavin reductase (DIM6/NTAB) family NADH-FMN oxidoreductase RutF